MPVKKGKSKGMNLYQDELQHLPPGSSEDLSDEQVLIEAQELKKKIAHKTIVLGHHYQQDDVISFADITGDSLQLAKEAARLDKRYIVFCGVHFMAETADILSNDDQTVILPDLRAGCSMADMAKEEQLYKAWNFLTQSTQEKIIPVTYINCAASLKSFVGKNSGSICTSSNAKQIIEWALDQGEKLLFFPDQHLGRNTCYQMGIPLEEMVVYNPMQKDGGLTAQQVQDAKVILWYGYCSVHQGFNLDQVKQIQKNKPKTTVLVHPECNFEVTQNAHLSGSTSFIIKTIANAKAGSSFAVGTEINLVNRLAQQFPDKEIFSLSPYQCLCTTMYRVRPRWLLESFRSIEKDQPLNVIKVDDETKKYSQIALNRMLAIS